MKCRLDTDMWDDAGTVYIVHSYNRHAEDSTAVTLELETEYGYLLTKVVASHQIEWIDDNES